MKTSPVPGVWFRAVPTWHRSNPLGFDHTFTAPSRYSAGKGHYPLLYLAPDRLLNYRRPKTSSLPVLDRRDDSPRRA